MRRCARSPRRTSCRRARPAAYRPGRPRRRRTGREDDGHAARQRLETLPAGLLVRDLAAEARALDALPPRLVRPRVAAELVRAVEVAGVRDVGYHPGAQRLEAVIADAAGTTAVVSADYSPHRPAALDALAAALAPSSACSPAPSARSAAASSSTRSPSRPRTASSCPTWPRRGTAALAAPPPATTDPLSRALDEALAACAEAAHRGLLRTTPGLRERIVRAGKDLDRAGPRRRRNRRRPGRRPRRRRPAPHRLDLGRRPHPAAGDRRTPLI